MKKRVFWSMFLSSVLILVLTSGLLIMALYKDFAAERKQEIVTESLYVATALGKTDTNYLVEIGKKSPNRITLVSHNGKVLFDSFAKASTLENHINRPEIKDALKDGSGESTRLSKTLGESTYYYALLLEDGNVLRVSITTRSFVGFIENTVLIIGLIVLLLVVIAIVTARAFTKKIVAPINNIDLDDPLSNNTYDELSSLLLRMDKQNKKISDQLSELEERQKEFNAITDNMSEALVVFGENKQVISANKSSRNLFENENIKNIGYLELCRDEGFIHCVESAFAGISAINKIYKNGKTYQLSVNPVKGDDTCAAVLFAVDITEKEQSEKMRREFTANVSHELKTPLTSIMGYAEIMQNGIAKEEDYKSFIDKIYSESKRLLTLMEDIIHLSRLDEEGIKNNFVPVDLYKMSEKVISELKDKAEKNKVLLSLNGKSHLINGIEETIHEIIYNLCDNAITYNKEGGSVELNVKKAYNHIVLSVKDTGIGIATEYQSRIFERFYRVDKSRSKETGGTGLGLPIVKHGAMLHNAQIKIVSNLGEGTEIKIIF